ncbi:YceI family protein [Mucilaginibacter ginsenosidivorans]|uniref:YceI family protein n=1 Tax=Mucilaginibacter ginsenosidivorans TaxID=398053 RepID=A0A5B8V266_9SPHI|nr:YceI family protein [Mucilaginibacter ginsenosidivorans]QEC65454.1 YceI family protein [Mucilaginibacter ginsenosidivorans]
MKKQTLLLVLIVASFQLQAQKLFATKTGQIKFNASSPLEQIVAINNQVDSKMIDKTGQIVFSALIKSFKFENQLMEDHFNENYMESSKIPKAEFKGYITNVSSVDFSKNGKYPITVEGTLAMHGVSQKVSTAGSIIIENGKPSISGSFKVKIKDYGITGLYIGEKIANEAEISINCKYE